LGNLKGRNHSENLSVDDNDIKMDIRETGTGGLDWIHLSEV
jgi:hypothetical protein